MAIQVQVSYHEAVNKDEQLLRMMVDGVYILYWIQSKNYQSQQISTSQTDMPDGEKASYQYGSDKS
jgi:hypothetical protein